MEKADNGENITTEELGPDALLQIGSYISSYGGPAATTKRWADFLYGNRSYSAALFAMEAIIAEDEFIDNEERENNITAYIDSFAFGYATLMEPSITTLPLDRDSVVGAMTDLLEICDRIENISDSEVVMSHGPGGILKAYGEDAIRRYHGLETIIKQYLFILNSMREPDIKEVGYRRAGFGMATHFALKIKQISTDSAFFQIMRSNDDWGESA